MLTEDRAIADKKAGHNCGLVVTFHTGTPDHLDCGVHTGRLIRGSIGIQTESGSPIRSRPLTSYIPGS